MIIIESSKHDILTGKVCPYCNNPTKYVDSAVVYHGRSYGMIYFCQPCDAYVGVHKGSNIALGRLANKDLRAWKKEAHKFFDPIWEEKIKQGLSKTKARLVAYTWLAEQMKLPRELTHVGMFDVEQCKQVVELCKIKPSI